MSPPSTATSTSATENAPGVISLSTRDHLQQFNKGTKRMTKQLATKQDAIAEVNRCVANATEADSFLVAVFHSTNGKITVDRVTYQFHADDLPIAAKLFAKQMQDEQANCKATPKKEPKP